MKGLQAGIINFVMSVVLISVLILGNKMVIRGQLNPNYIGILVMMALNIFYTGSYCIINCRKNKCGSVHQQIE